MEAIILFIIVAVLNSAFGGKNKAKKGGRRAAAPQRRSASAPMPRDAFAPKGPFAPRAQQEAPKPAARQTLIEQEKGRCESKPLHLHEVTQAQMQAAGEGEDPCHRGGAVRAAQPAQPSVTPAPERPSASPVYASPLDEDEDERREQMRRDVMRGIVMSEILTTPRQRRALRRAAAEGGHR